MKIRERTLDCPKCGKPRLHRLKTEFQATDLSGDSYEGWECSLCGTFRRVSEIPIEEIKEYEAKPLMTMVKILHCQKCKKDMSHKLRTETLEASPSDQWECSLCGTLRRNAERTDAISIRINANMIVVASVVVIFLILLFSILRK